MLLPVTLLASLALVLPPSLAGTNYIQLLIRGKTLNKTNKTGKLGLLLVGLPGATMGPILDILDFKNGALWAGHTKHTSFSI